MSTLTWPKPCAPSISRSFGALDSSASRVTALWLVNQTCACPARSAVRTSMVPRAGGLTCSLAVFKLPSIMMPTWSATPCPNSALSTPADTLNVGVGDESVTLELAELSSCAAAVPSLDAPGKKESDPPPRECLSAPAAPPAADTTCAIDAAVAAVIAADAASDEGVADAASPGAAPRAGAAPR